MRMNYDKLNRVIMRWNYMAKGQMKFSVDIHQIMKIVKSFYPLCSHNTCEYKHIFLNGVTINE